MNHEDSYWGRKACNAEGPLRFVNPTMPDQVKQRRHSLPGGLTVNPFGHLISPIGLTPIFITRVCPLLSGLNSTGDKVPCHHHSI